MLLQRPPLTSSAAAILGVNERLPLSFHPRGSSQDANRSETLKFIHSGNYFTAEKMDFFCAILGYYENLAAMKDSYCECGSFTHKESSVYIFTKC